MFLWERRHCNFADIQKYVIVIQIPIQSIQKPLVPVWFPGPKTGPLQSVLTYLYLSTNMETGLGDTRVSLKANTLRSIVHSHTTSIRSTSYHQFTFVQTSVSYDPYFTSDLYFLIHLRYYLTYTVLMRCKEPT